MAERTWDSRYAAFARMSSWRAVAAMTCAASSCCVAPSPWRSADDTAARSEACPAAARATCSTT